MHRRALLSAAPAATLLAAPALAQTATATPEIRWRLTSSFPRSTDILFGTAELVAQRVAALTGGRFQIRAFPAGELVGGLQALDAVQANTVEMAHTATYYFIGKDPSLAFFTALPFGLNARQHLAWLKFGGGDAALEEVLADFNCTGMPCGNTGAQMGGWFRREIHTLDELRGLKFRISGLAGEVFVKLGAVPTQTAAADIYPSLERGTIDAAEFVGPYDDERLGFNRVAPNYYAPGFWEPGAQLHLLVNRGAYATLPDAYKEALRSAVAEAGGEMMAKYDNANPAALRRLVAGGAQLRFWSRDILGAAWRASNELYDEKGRANARFGRIWEAYRRYRDEEYTWFRVAESSFDSFAFSAAQTVR